MAQPASKTESLENVSNQDIKTFLDVFTNTLNKLKISKDKIFKDICQNRNFLEILLQLNSLEATPLLITHLMLLLNYLSKTSSSTILDSLRLYHANIEIIQALLTIVDANAIKILWNNLNITFDCANEVINERLQEIENLKVTVRNSPVSTFTSAIESIIQLKAPDSNDEITSYKKQHKIINCRKNVASILRTGALVAKKMKFNDAIVEEIIAGGNNPFLLEANKANIIKMAHKKEVEEIERRHLLGLISNEEAKRAKIDAIKCKQKAASELKKEKNRLRKLMNEEFERSVSQSKVIIRKIHLNRLVLKKKKFDVILRKKIIADQVKKIRAEIKQEIKAIKWKEMEEKMELIQKIRLLEKTRNLNKKSSKESLKSSIDELRASIANIQHQLNDERENRQKRILAERNRHKQLIQKTETLIDISRKLFHQRDRVNKEKVKRLAASRSPDLIQLREKLLHVRKIVSYGKSV